PVAEGERPGAGARRGAVRRTGRRALRESELLRHLLPGPGRRRPSSDPDRERAQPVRPQRPLSAVDPRPARRALVAAHGSLAGGRATGPLGATPLLPSGVPMAEGTDGDRTAGPVLRVDADQRSAREGGASVRLRPLHAG